MDGDSGFITPPPGLFPNAPAAAPVPAETQSGTHQYVRPQEPARPPAQPPAFFPAPLGAQPRLATLTLEADDGTRHVITARAVIGRNPTASGEWSGAVAIAMDDPGKSVSKTHAGVIVTPTGSTVTDLDSTNGTVVVRASGEEVALSPRAPVAVQQGEVIHIGSRWLRVLGS